jgi:hypothetical protein
MRHHPLRSKKRWFILLAMVEFSYRGREITQEDILYICSLIERPQRQPPQAIHPAL